MSVMSPQERQALEGSASTLGVTPLAPAGAPTPSAAPAPQLQPIPATHPPLKPVLTPPAGPPVPVLTARGFFGSMAEFNQRVQAITDSYTAATNGAAPKPAFVLDLATRPDVPTDAIGKTVVDGIRAANNGGVTPPASSSTFTVTPVTSHDLLQGLIGNAKAGGYDTFMKMHGAQLQDLLHNPETQAAATAALAQAKQIDSLNTTEEAGPGFGSVAKSIVEAPAHVVSFAARASLAFTRDVDSAREYTATRGKQGSIAFPELTKTSPALAQVVKGLVYSPAGLYETAKALALDTKAAAEYAASNGKNGSIGFEHTTALAHSVGHQFLLDLADTHGNRTGYLMLDLFGLASAGVGTAARVGRAATAIDEGSTLSAAARAAATPHPLKTFELSKNGFGEQIALSSSPLTAWLQEFAPGVGLRARQARIDAAGVEPVAKTLHGDPIESLLADDPIGDSARWASDVLSSERMIGRHGDIRRTTEYNAMMGLKAQLDQTAGSVARQTVLSRLLPDNVLAGLSKGEVKALQALSWDDPNPLSAEEHFHQSMLEQGIGDPAAHKEQIALLGLARKALEEPSDRFQKTLDAVTRVTAQTEEWRIGLGLGVDTAAERVARAGAILREDDLVKAPDGTTGIAIRDKNGEPVDVVPLNKQSPDSWYSPTYLKGKPQRSPGAQGPAARGLSPFGLGPTPSLTEMKHEMTGDALRDGNIRIDAHNLAGEGYARTAKAIQQFNEWQRAWASAKPGLPADGEIAIRDLRTIPDNLRASLSQFLDGHLSQSAVEALPPELHEMLFPDADKLTDADREHVRSIDPRMLGQFAKASKPLGGASRVMEKVNNLLRPLIFYDNPKYALNLIGNHSMLIFDQGFLRSSQNIARALSLDNWAIGDDAATIKALVGSSRSESYVNPASGAISKGLADFWNKFTDQGERTAAWLYYADRKGYKSPEEIHELLTDPAKKSDMLDVNERADASQVAYDRMSAYEKATVRHWLFVYPWVRGSTMWSLRAVYEHPAKTALLTTLGQEAYTDDPWLKTVTKWVERTGYIPLYWHGNNPVVADPTSVNTFSTLAQLLETAKAAVHGDKYASMGDLLGPPGQFIAHAALGVDQNGNAYKGSALLGSAIDTLTFLAPYAAVKRAEKGEGAPLKPFNVAHRASLDAQANSALKQTVLDPGWLSGFGTIIAGGFSPRELNLSAAAARYWQTAPPAQRHEHEVELLDKALTLQGDYLKQPVPQGVRDAVKDAAQITWAKREFQKTYGRNPTAKEGLLITIKYLREAGRIDKKTEKTLTSSASKLSVVPDINEMHSAVLTKYGSLGELTAWDSDVSTLVALTNKPELSSRLAILNQHGLATQKVYNLTAAQRLAYGRQYVAYLNERRDLAKQVKGQTGAANQLAIFDDEHDKAVGNLPSVTRLRLVDGASDVAEARLDRLVNASWGDLTGAEKTALGRPTAPGLTLAWAAYRKTLADIRASGGSVATAGKAAAAKLWNKQYPGFLQDWLYSQKPKVERFQYTTAYKTLPDKTLFDQAVLAPAKQILQAVKEGGSKTAADRVWRTYVTEKLTPWLKNQPELEAALKPFGTRFLETLVNG